MFTSEAGGNNVGKGNVIIDARTPIENDSNATLSCNPIIDNINQYDDMCFTIKRISGSEQKCLKGAQVLPEGEYACLGTSS